MSHTAKINVQFTDLELLTKAFKALNWTIKEKATARTYPGDPASHTVYDFVACNPQTNGYDIGITLNKETNELSLFGDFYGGSIAASLGENVNALRKEYSAATVEQYFMYMGADVQRQVNADGTITMEVNGEFQLA